MNEKKIVMVLLFMSIAIVCLCAPVTLPKTWIASETIKASDLNANFNAIKQGCNSITTAQWATGTIVPTTSIQNGALIASHSGRHRYNAEDPLVGEITVQLRNSTATTDFDFGGFRAKSIASPATGTDAVNKDYADTKVSKVTTTGTQYCYSSSGALPFLTLWYGNDSISTSTWHNSVGLTEIDLLDSRAPSYANIYKKITISTDYTSEPYITLTGCYSLSGLATNTLYINSRGITGLIATPTSDTDATPKFYVDRLVASATPLPYIQKGTASSPVGTQIIYMNAGFLLESLGITTPGATSTLSLGYDGTMVSNSSGSTRYSLTSDGLGYVSGIDYFPGNTYAVNKRYVDQSISTLSTDLNASVSASISTLSTDISNLSSAITNLSVTDIKLGTNFSYNSSDLASFTLVWGSTETTTWKEFVDIGQFTVPAGEKWLCFVQGAVQNQNGSDLGACHLWTIGCYNGVSHFNGGRALSMDDSNNNGSNFTSVFMVSSGTYYFSAMSPDNMNGNIGLCRLMSWSYLKFKE